MNLSSGERQSLIGPLVVGCLLGAFVAFAIVAFYSEVSLQSGRVGWVRVLAEAAIGFLLSVLCTVGSLGVLPVLLHRRSSKGSEDA